MSKKKCEYCQNGSLNVCLIYLENHHDDDTYFDEISVGIVGKKLILKQDTDMESYSDADYTRIRFCPMCGRKLEGEDQK